MTIYHLTGTGLGVLTSCEERRMLAAIILPLLRKWRLKGSAAHLRNEPAQSVLRACAAFARVRRSAPAAGSSEEGAPSFVLSAGSPARVRMLCFCGEKTFTGLRGTACPHAPHTPCLQTGGFWTPFWNPAVIQAVEGWDPGVNVTHLCPPEADSSWDEDCGGEEGCWTSEHDEVLEYK